jgi:N6-L-threonylcarbamoyladenine synthase
MATQGPRRYVLGIETSCDDTGAAIVDEDGRIISEALSSQLAVHLRNGGIIPPIARDLHREKIESVVAECLLKSGLDPAQLSAIAVTNRPGMSLSLFVGLNYAKKIAALWNKPLIPIHHMEAHALTIRMVEDVKFPFLVMLISGNMLSNYFRLISRNGLLFHLEVDGRKCFFNRLSFID